MLIRTISDEKALGLIREWNGQAPGGRAAESERAFQAMCDRFTLVEVESAAELARLDSMEKYITGGHGFYLYVRYPSDVLEAIRAGRAALPHFVHRAEERYSSAYSRGSLKLLLGFLQEAVDPNYDIGLFADVMDRQKKAREAALRALRQPVMQPVYQQPAPQPQPEPQPAPQPVAQTVPQQQTYQQPVYQQPVYQPERRTSNVIHYHFGNQVS